MRFRHHCLERPQHEDDSWKRAGLLKTEALHSTGGSTGSTLSRARDRDRLFNRTRFIASWRLWDLVNTLAIASRQMNLRRELEAVCLSYIMPAIPSLPSWSAWPCLLQSVQWLPSLRGVPALDLSVLQPLSRSSEEKLAQCAGALLDLSPVIRLIHFFFSYHRSLKIVCLACSSHLSYWRITTFRNVTVCIHSVVPAGAIRRVICASGIMVWASQRWQCSLRKSPHSGPVSSNSRILASHLPLSLCTTLMGASRIKLALRSFQNLPV